MVCAQRPTSTPYQYNVMKLTPEDYLKMRDRCKELERDSICQREHILDLERINAQLSDAINRMDGGCARAIELRQLLDELFEIKPNELVSDDQIRLKMRQLREQCANLENENKLQQDHIKNLRFCLTDVSKSAEKYYDEAEAYIKLKNQYHDQCNLLLEEKAGLEKRLRDIGSLNDSLMKELANRQGCRPESQVREHDADLYQLDVLKYAPDHHDYLLNVIYAAMGMCGEAGEASELIKKYAFHGHMLDSEHLARELGDVLWYVSYIAQLFGYTLGKIMAMNQEKLAKRYPDGKFDADRSRNREEGDI